MNKFKGTPGPWHVVLSDNATPHILHEHGYDSTDCTDLSSRVCVMPAEIVANYNSLANARLIAAAPKLLDAAIMAIEHYDAYFKGCEPPEDLPWVPVMREVIKEALGEDME